VLARMIVLTDYWQFWAGIGLYVLIVATILLWVLKRRR